MLQFVYYTIFVFERSFFKLELLVNTTSNFVFLKNLFIDLSLRDKDAIRAFIASDIFFFSFLKKEGSTHLTQSVAKETEKTTKTYDTSLKFNCM